MYKYIEQVFKYRSVNKDRPFPVRFFALSALLTIIAVIPAIHAKTHNGWEWRVIDSGSFDFDVSEFRCRNHLRNPGHEYTCNIGSESQEVSKALLVGDSHAGQFSAGLDYLGKRHEIRVEMWIHPGCPPLWNTYKIYGTNSPGKQETCKKLVPKWEEAMISGRYDYIIIAARWMYLYEPVDYGDKKIRRDILVDRHNPLIDVNNSRKLFVSRLKMTIDNIVKSGAKVIVFSQIPLVGRNIKNCKNKPFFNYTDELLEASCSNNVAYEDVVGRLKFTDMAIQKLSSENVLSIIPSHFLCDNSAKICKTVIDNILLYRDSQHLSKRGSVLFATKIEDMFSKLVSKAE